MPHAGDPEHLVEAALAWAQGKPIHLYDGPAFLQVMQRIKGPLVLDTDKH